MMPNIYTGKLLFFFMNLAPSKHKKSGHYRPISETPFEWRFAGVLVYDGRAIGKFKIFVKH